MNPVAGVGGPAALKGSDALSTREAVFSGELPSRAKARALQFIVSLRDTDTSIAFFCIAGPMGSEVLDEAGVAYSLVKCQVKNKSDGSDTQFATEELIQAGIDILVFVGGDGTARDVCEVASTRQLCLGVPAGVKMQSAVFGIHPVASAEVINAIAEGKIASVAEQEVRDIDEALLASGKVRSRHFGFMKIPADDNLIQSVKQGESAADELLFSELADEILENIDAIHSDSCLLIFGPGSTTYKIQQELGLPGSLLGVDVFCGKDVLGLDVNDQMLGELVEKHEGEVRLVLTIIGGQGHIIGRGNQQISAKILRKIGKENCWLVASKQKLQNLNGRPLIIDSGDEALNRSWIGLIEVVCGYRERVLYALGGQP